MSQFVPCGPSWEDNTLIVYGQMIVLSLS